MNRLFCWAVGTAVVAFSTMTGCATSGDGDGGIECTAGLLPGDLVITEIMANPEGADDGNEWFEVFNNTGGPVDLTGVVLTYRSSSGTVNTHVLDGVMMPDGYFVFGGILPEFAPDYVGYGYGSALGSMGNSGGRLALACDVIEVDGVDYQEIPSGRSMGLSSTVFPDHNENDRWDDWCAGNAVYMTENQGTPGAPNDCTGIIEDGMCLENGMLRPIVTPMVGDLVITEVMPDSAGISDTSGEWFEVKATADVDLYGLELGRDDGVEFTLSEDSADCLPLATDEYMVLAKNDDPMANGGIEGALDYTGVSLINDDGTLFIGVDGEVLDQVTWAGSDSGASLNLDPDFCDTRLNDDPANWCNSDDNLYDAENGNYGTPGASNEQCPPVVAPGFCLDEGTGAVREIVSPGVGDLTITEYLANPEGRVAEGDGEWIEFKANAVIDLNAVEIRKRADSGTMGETPLVDADVIECVTTTVNAHYLLVRDPDPANNGCLGDFFGEFNFSLNNSNNTIFLSVGALDIDEVYYSATTAAGSSSLDDGSGMWCYNTTDVYDTCEMMPQHTGTPGAANPSCPASP